MCKLDTSPSWLQDCYRYTLNTAGFLDSVNAGLIHHIAGYRTATSTGYIQLVTGLLQLVYIQLVSGLCKCRLDTPPSWLLDCYSYRLNTAGYWPATVSLYTAGFWIV